MKTRRQVSSGGVVVRRGPRGAEVLLASRRTRRGDLVWGLPKGLVEHDEDPEQTAIREVEEETGYRATVREPLGDISYWFVWEGTRVHKTVRFFLMDAAAEEPGPRDQEMEAVEWFPVDQAQRVAGFDSERDVLRRAGEALGAGA